ncbi:unnamed protein product [Nesidiocoris tenuis]|uniref:Uncharacterized protein n=1 Tax=Nesidiocoris tenuis TaxID=355587 RepID=A0A6H5H381_9HEMI|nr:unnamed protein product [Nesidiocoris tenuis]
MSKVLWIMDNDVRVRMDEQREKMYATRMALLFLRNGSQGWHQNLDSGTTPYWLNFALRQSRGLEPVCTEDLRDGKRTVCRLYRLGPQVYHACLLPTDLLRIFGSKELYSIMYCYISLN